MSPPDPMAHGCLIDQGRLTIRDLNSKAIDARYRVIQGDWTAKYANEKLAKDVAEAEARLIKHGATVGKVYAHISPSARVLVSYSYTWNGEAREGHSNPTGY